MKFVLQYSCVLLLFLFSYSPKKAQSSNFTVQFQVHSPPDSLQYTVQLNLFRGEYNQSLSLGLDTGHRLTLIRTCNEKPFGSSYSPIRCDETECSELCTEQRKLLDYCKMCSQTECFEYVYGRLLNETCALNSTCDYAHHDSYGTLSKVANLTHDFPADFVVGCGEQGAEPIFSMGAEDGLLGLGRGGQLSFVSRFSYCLPSTSTSTGYFTFNNTPPHDDDDAALFSFTPFAVPLDTTQYFVDIIAVTVGGTQLPIDYQTVIRGTVIDTGSLITRLPPAAYVPMRDEFRRQMGTNYTASEQFPIFDTCYNTTNLDSMSITPPPVSFTFKDDVTVDLDASGILYDIDYANLRCFAFAPSDYRDDYIPFDHSYHTDFVVFASAQQRTLEMVFDVANNKLGFRQNGCA